LEELNDINQQNLGPVAAVGCGITIILILVTGQVYIPVAIGAGISIILGYYISRK